MRKYKKVLSLIMVFVLVFPCASFAENDDAQSNNPYADKVNDDLSYFDDVYRFDLDMEENVEVSETIDDEKAVFTVVSLGLMQLMADGTFSQELPVPFDEFSGIVYMLSTGDTEKSSAGYTEYKDRNTTYGEAVEYIVKALGYDELAKQSSSGGYMSLGRKLGIASGNSAEGKFITRGELATMIYKALNTNIVEIVNYNRDGNYTLTEGGKLINERLDTFEIRGLLTGVAGINIYSTKRPETDKIEIDRVTYETNGNDYSDLLGRYVFGYVRNSRDDDIPVVLGLMTDNRDKSLVIRLSDIESVNRDYLYYTTENGKKKVSVAGLTNILYNGDIAENFVFDEELFKNDGEILLGSSKGDGKFDIAVISARQSYRIRNISKTEKKLFFADGLKLNGKEYLEIDEDKNDIFLKVVKNGKVISFDEIVKGDVISVIQNGNGLYTHITVSQKIVMGKVTGRIDDSVIIGNTEYAVSKLYLEESQKSGATAQKFTIGIEGRFYLTADNTIAGFEGDDGIQYGLLGEIANSGGLKNDLIVRFLTEKGEWKDMYAASKLELDGQKKISAGDAYDILSASPEAFYKPIRYKVNGNDEITFLDTIIENSEEYSDEESLVLSATWSGTTHYTSPYVIYNDNDSYYLYEAVVFFVPDDLSEEDEFSAGRSTSIPDKTRVELELYNIDEVGRTPVIVYDGTVRSSGGSYTDRAFALESVRYVLDEDEEYVLKLSGYEQIHVSPGVGSWNKVEFKVNKAWLEEQPTLDFKPGDVFLYQLNSKGELINRDLLVRDNQLKSSSSSVIGDITWCYGTVEALDFSGPFKLVKIKCVNSLGETMERTFIPRGVQIYDSNAETFESTTLEEYEIGDTILAVGNRAHVSVTVFR